MPEMQKNMNRVNGTYEDSRKLSDKFKIELQTITSDPDSVNFRPTTPEPKKKKENDADTVNFRKS